MDGQAKKNVVEKIWPAQHIRENQWQSEWNQEYWKRDYDYISDYECIFKHPIVDDDVIELYQGEWNNLQAAKQRGTNVPITNLAHFTNQKNAEGIIENGGFRGGMKKINKDAQGNYITAKFSWWSPIFTEEDKNQVRGTLGEAIDIVQPFFGQHDDLANLQNQFATSDAFTPKPKRYGSRYFQYGINELCEYYADSIHDEVRYKILGTFGYKQEIMHAVLVCSQLADGAGRFGAYPSVPAEDVNEAVVTRGNHGSWTWKPQATGGTEIRRLDGRCRYPMYRRWENVAFAFHIPDEWGYDPENETFMAVPNLQDHLHPLPE